MPPNRFRACLPWRPVYGASAWYRPGNPSQQEPPCPPSTRTAAPRTPAYLFLLIPGLVLGVVATVMAMRALEQRKDHFPRR